MSLAFGQTLIGTDFSVFYEGSQAFSISRKFIACNVIARKYGLLNNKHEMIILAFLSADLGLKGFNPHDHGSFAEPMRHQCRQIRPHDMW